jgi:hypothetical protein
MKLREREMRIIAKLEEMGVKKETKEKYYGDGSENRRE